VNVSAVQFWQPGLVQTVAKVLADTGIDPQCVELEITESVLMRHADTTIATLQALKEMRVKISVDDFGTGYSSLSYLRPLSHRYTENRQIISCDVIKDAESAAIVQADRFPCPRPRSGDGCRRRRDGRAAGILPLQRCDRVKAFCSARRARSPISPRC